MFLSFVHFLWLYLIVSKTTTQSSISTKKDSTHKCSACKKKYYFNIWKKHIDFVVKRQVNAAFIYTAHILIQFFFLKKMNQDSHNKTKKETEP